jgi:glycosyltransferase involved in cell wall biosynthesis
MNPEFSIIIPLLNEAESIAELIARITDSFKRFGKSFEIIFIDDGSTDGSLELLKKYSRDHKNIHVISFRKNLGKSPALTVGFEHAKGDYILTMDADLQDDPVNIETLFQKMEEKDLDLVSGWRKDRRDTFFKRTSSRLFNAFIIPLLFGLHFHDMNCGLKLYRKVLAKELRIYGGMHRFIPVLASEMGFKVSETPIVHHSRKYGHSKYKPSKILTDIPDLFTMFFLTKYTRRPLHFFFQLGMISLLVGMAILGYLVIIKLMGEAIGGRPLLIFGVLFVLGGAQTIFTGLLADLIVNANERTLNNYRIKYRSSGV